MGADHATTLRRFVRGAEVGAVADAERPAPQPPRDALDAAQVVAAH